MVDEHKKALRQLQKKLVEMIREIESEESSCPHPVHIATDDFEFRLEYSKKLKRFLVLMKPSEET